MDYRITRVINNNLSTVISNKLSNNSVDMSHVWLLLILPALVA